MPSHTVLPDDLRFHEDIESERYHQRYELALKRITAGDVLSEVDHLIDEESDERKHPLYALAKHCLSHGTYRTSGQRSHLADFLTARFEDMIDEAIQLLVNEELESGVSWED
jgi:hypothetical protein